MSFLKAYEEFLEYAKKRHKKQSFDVLTYNFNANILTFFKDFNLEDITFNNIVMWQDFILEKNFCNNHNKNLFSMLKNFFHYCSLHFDFDYTIIERVEEFPKRIEEKHIDFYNLNEFNLFIKNVDNIVYKQFFNFMFYAGTRPGEAMALKFSDLGNFSIRINKTIDEHGNRNIDVPKTQSSIRTIQLDKKLYYELISLKEYYFKLYGKFDLDYFIFGGTKPLAPTTINRYKLKACEKANLRPITLHQFRHSHATLLLHNNILINEISKRLGHAKVSTTFDIYTHTDLLHEKRVLKTLNSLRFNFFDVLTYNFKKLISILKHNVF